MKSEATRIAILRTALQQEANLLREQGNSEAGVAIETYLDDATDESLLRLHGLIQYHGLIRSDQQ